MEYICPACGGSLQKGYIQSPRRIVWTTKKRLLSVPAPEEGMGEFSLPDSESLHVSNCPATHCPSCGLILISTKEDREA